MDRDSENDNFRIWCIHGNLQLPTVWAPFKGRLTQNLGQSEPAPISLICEDLWASIADDPGGWARIFCTKVRLTSKSSTNLIMGYSLGGRLAMHALLAAPELWRGAILVGADPGFSEMEQRSAQSDVDRIWAKRFQVEPWEQLLDDWDRQPLFGDRPNSMPRCEANFSRDKVAQIFLRYSKGRQGDLWPALAALTAPPILYLSGQEDGQYNRVGEKLAATCPTVCNALIPGAAHRAPWDNSDHFLLKVQRFIDQLA